MYGPDTQDVPSQKMRRLENAVVADAKRFESGMRRLEAQVASGDMSQGTVPVHDSVRAVMLEKLYGDVSACASRPDSCAALFNNTRSLVRRSNQQAFKQQSLDSAGGLSAPSSECRAAMLRRLMADVDSAASGRLTADVPPVHVYLPISTSTYTHTLSGGETPFHLLYLYSYLDLYFACTHAPTILRPLPRALADYYYCCYYYY